MLIKSLGVITLFHAAFAVVQHREANPGVIISSPPSHILIQLLGGFFIALVGTIASIEPLGIVRGNSSKKEKPGYVAPPPQYKTREFDVFNHRVIG